MARVELAAKKTMEKLSTLIPENGTGKLVNVQVDVHHDPYISCVAVTGTISN